jgi:MoaA/NifB/PqqE/SkfB family radical SAM enzyme
LPVRQQSSQEKDFFFQWHLTGRCNLACSHCYQEGAPGREADAAAIAKIADAAADTVAAWGQSYGIAFSPAFNVTGGEPLILPGIMDVLTLLKGKGFGVSLLTNGTLVDREKARRLADLLDDVQISVEGPERVHDAIRGQGSLAGAMRGAELLAAAGIPVNLNVTLSRLNIDCIDDVIAMARDAGAQRVGFSRLVPSGRGRDLAREMLSPDEVRDAYARLLGGGAAAAEPAVPIRISTGDPIASALEGAQGDCGAFPYAGCAAGVSGLTILPDGTLLPCRRLPVPIGNALTGSIRRVWAESPVLETLRDRKSYKGRCGACERWAECRGCRAIAYASSGLSGRADLCADDPQCFL